MKNEKTQFGNIVAHTKIQLCEKFGQIITNYATEMVMSWLFDLKPIYVFIWWNFLWRNFFVNFDKNQVYQDYGPDVAHLAWKPCIFLHCSFFVRTLFWNSCIIPSFLLFVTTRSYIMAQYKDYIYIYIFWFFWMYYRVFKNVIKISDRNTLHHFQKRHCHMGPQSLVLVAVRQVG